MSSIRKCTSVALCFLLAIPFWKLPCSKSSGAQPRKCLSYDDLALLDPSTVRLIELDNSTLTHSLDIDFDLEIFAERIDSSMPSRFALYVNSIDDDATVLIMGGVNPQNQRWMHSVRFSREEAEDLFALMQQNGWVSAMGNRYVSLSTNEPGFFDGFWDGYWHYLTNPSEMDADLEIAFYGAVGTAAVAGTAAGGVYIWTAAGGSTFGAGIVTTSETSVLFTVNGGTYMGTASGVVNVTGRAWATLSTNWLSWGYYTHIQGIPIISGPSALAGAGGTLWLPNHPCISRAVQAFFGGWGW